MPSTSDLQPLLTWLSTMERAHINLGRCRWGSWLGKGRGGCLVSNLAFLSRLQKDLCWAHLPRLFSAAMNCFLSPHSQVVSAAAQTLEVLHADTSLLGCPGPCGGLCHEAWGLPGSGMPSVPVMLGVPWSNGCPIFLVCPCRLS